MTTLNIAETVKLHHATRGKAERLAEILAAEYPRLSIRPAYNEDESQVVSWVVVYTDEDGMDNSLTETPKVPDLADILDACTEEGIDPEEGADEEEDRARVVVPQRYKDEYAARGNPAHCGDWLAIWLEEQCHDADGRLDVEAFRSILTQNGVEQTGKWATLPESRQKGWQGRYRMNGRQKLEIVVAREGVVIALNGVAVKPDLEALEAMLDRHPSIEAKWALEDA